MKLQVPFLFKRFKKHSFRITFSKLHFCLLLSICMAGCSKKSDTDLEIVGQWDINRSVLTGFPSNFSNYENTTLAGVDVMKELVKINSDNSFIDTYKDDNNAIRTLSGTWTYHAPTLTLMVTGTTANGKTLVFTYNSGSNELSTGKRQMNSSFKNPNTNTYEPVYYYVENFYTKK